MSINGEIKINKGVPVPVGKQGKHVYPWQEMEIGDSFFVSGGKPSQLISNARRAGVNAISRTVTEGKIKGVRVWRIA